MFSITSCINVSFTSDNIAEKTTPSNTTLAVQWLYDSTVASELPSIKIIEMSYRFGHNRGGNNMYTANR